ncbi:hypothetical protein B0T22DRAFT_462178 [Podospora appendiculata]|uniref:Uncharacterized protein n=1 Tax=Podospora appendiculata TaxID=314037 RepID=A0AAE1CDM7_9PEZI|nr:hypothetical protein B0T22DRAFT_462178 [Podospora appendiculata]
MASMRRQGLEQELLPKQHLSPVHSLVSCMEILDVGAQQGGCEEVVNQKDERVKDWSEEQRECKRSLGGPGESGSTSRPMWIRLPSCPGAVGSGEWAWAWRWLGTDWAHPTRRSISSFLAGSKSPATPPAHITLAHPPFLPPGSSTNLLLPSLFKPPPEPLRNNTHGISIQEVLKLHFCHSFIHPHLSPSLHFYPPIPTRASFSQQHGLPATEQAAHTQPIEPDLAAAI